MSLSLTPKPATTLVDRFASWENFLAILTLATVAYAVVRTTMPMRTYVYDFLRTVSPRLARSKIEAAVEQSVEAGRVQRAKRSSA